MPDAVNPGNLVDRVRSAISSCLETIAEKSLVKRGTCACLVPFPSSGGVPGPRIWLSLQHLAGQDKDVRT